jgi:hypothetical protein
MFAPPRNRPPPFYEIIESHPLSAPFLLPALATFHVDIEFAGAHAGFFEKFVFRSATSEIIDYCWPMPHHRQSLLDFAKDPATQPRFLRFANAVANGSFILLNVMWGTLRAAYEFLHLRADFTFNMESALKALTTVREIEKEQDNIVVSRVNVASSSC